MNNFLLKGFVLAQLLLASGVAYTSAQPNHSELIKQINDEELRERVGAMRGLAIAVVRGIATPDQRSSTLEVLKKLTGDNEPVVRLAAHVELLKIAAAEDDVELSKFAIRSCQDENVNVRRGTLKFFRSFYAGRYQYGKVHQAMLLKMIEDPDLESRFHAAATLHSWGISNEKIINIMIDSLGLSNYRASSLHSLITREKDREGLIDILMERLSTSAHNAGIHVNVVAMLTPESKSRTAQLLKYYDSESASVRAAVIDAIGRLQSAREHSMAVLDRAIEDESPVIRRLVLTSLIRLEPEPAKVKSVMLRLLTDEDEKVCLAAADAFAWFENDFDAIVPDIETVLASENKKHVIAALHGCLSSGPMSAALGSAVAELLKHGQTDVQMRASWALEEMEVDRRIYLDSAQHALSNQPENNALATILDAMSRQATPQDDCRQWFEKYLDHENPNIRLSCCIGLKNYPSIELIETVIFLPRSQPGRSTGEMLNMDDAVVEFLLATGEAGARQLVPFLNHRQPHVRGRAIRALAQSEIVTEDIRNQMADALTDDDQFVRTCAAFAVTRFDKLDVPTLERVFNVSDPNDRQQTVRILELLAGLGEKAAPITPRIAYLMNGGYRNRYSTDAMRALIALGEHAAPATDALLVEPFNLPKIECIAAIGPGARQAENKLKTTIAQMESKIEATRLLRQKDLSRRIRVAAAIALWRVSGDGTLASRILSQELDGDARDMALAALPSFKDVDQATLLKVIAMLPDPKAINALGQLGEPARPAVQQLINVLNSPDESVFFDASRALWNITGEPGYAMDVVEQILHRNRYNLVEIRVEDRQQLWEALRFLESTDNADAKSLLNQIQRGRYPNLRSFVRQLRESNSVS